MNNKTNWLKILLAPAFALGLSFAVVGCDDGDMDDDTIGENVDEGINSVERGTEEMGNDIERGTEELGNNIEREADELGDDADDLLENE